MATELFRLENLPFYQIILGDDGIVIIKSRLLLTPFIAIALALSSLGVLYSNRGLWNTFNTNTYFTQLVLVIWIILSGLCVFAPSLWQRRGISRMTPQEVAELINTGKRKNRLTQWSNVKAAFVKKDRFVIVILNPYQKKVFYTAKLKQSYPLGASSPALSSSFLKYLSQKLGERFKALDQP